MADPKPIKQDITVDAEQAKRELQDVAHGTRELSKSTEDSANSTNKAEQVHKQANRTIRDSTNELDKMAGSVDGVTGGFASMVLQMSTGAGVITAAIAGITTYFHAMNQAADDAIERLETILDKVQEATDATLELHAINLGYSEADEKLVSTFSKATGRSFQESARTLTRFRSANAALDKETQDKLFTEGLLPVALTTTGSLDPAAKFIGRISSITQDPEEIKNLIAYSVKLAGEADPSQFVGEAGELLVSGNASGLSPADTLSLLAFASGKFETAEAGTKPSNIITKFNADPATLEKLQGLGVDPNSDFFTKLNKLSSSGADQGQLVDLVGLEKYKVLQSLVDENATVQDFRQQTNDAVGGGDLIGDFIQDLITKSPNHARALKIAQQAQELADLERQDAERAQIFEIARGALEYELEKAVQDGTLDPSAKKARLGQFEKHFNNLDFRRHVRGDLNAGIVELTEEQKQLLGDKSAISLPLNEITPQQIAESAAQAVEKNGVFTDLIQGGDRSDYVELSDQVRDAVNSPPNLPESVDQSSFLGPSETGQMFEQIMRAIEARGLATGNQPTIVVQRLSINNGTSYQGLGNPLIDDLDGRDRLG